MNELEDVNDSLLVRSLGMSPDAAAGEWRETPLMPGLSRLFREIDAYLEFVAISRGG